MLRCNIPSLLHVVCTNETALNEVPNVNEEIHSLCFDFRVVMRIAS